MNFRKTVSHIFLLITLISSILVNISCATTSRPVSKAETKPAELKELPYRMAWEINGTDKQGKPSRIIIQGTIHIGTPELMNTIPDQMFYGIDQAQRVAGELSSRDMETITPQIQKLMIQGASSGKFIPDYLTDEETVLLSYLSGGNEMMNLYSRFEPWVLTNLVTSAIYTMSGFSSDCSMDSTILQYSNAMGKESLGLDTVEDQLQILAYGTYDQQLLMLKDLLSTLDINNLQDSSSITLLQDMYNAYYSDNRDALAALIKEDSESEQHDFSQDYLYRLYDERNQKWAAKIADYLYEGGTTFIYAGSAHFLGDNSVFHYMKLQGTIN